MTIRRILSISVLLAMGSCAMVAEQHPGYPVFFDKISARLDSAADGVVAEAAAAAKQQPGAQVVVLGYTGNAGGPQADQALSDARAKAVADQLAADGVDPSRISSQGRGKSSEDPSVARRRVDIQIGS